MKTFVRLAPWVLVAALLAVAAVVLRPARPAGRTAGVDAGPLWVWSVYEGSLDARHVDVILSQFSGGATIVELAREGTPVAKGDRLVRFDDSQVRRDLVRLERDQALASSELTSLRQAKLPMEIRDLELRLLEARANQDSEKQYAGDCVELAKEGLVSEQEVAQQRLKADRMGSAVSQLENQIALTKEYLHPAALSRAAATLAAADQELKLALEQLTNCTVYAPCDGTVVYRPLQVGSEYRTARVGDTIQRNQPFLALPDMRDVVVQCLVPEAELSSVSEGARAFVVPLPYPDLNLEGEVESIGSMAQAVPGRNPWQRYFAVVVRVRTPDARLRSGMSAQARILSYYNAQAVRVPRAAVWWSQGEARCSVPGVRGSEDRPLKLGRANHEHYEVLAGLKPGERVVLP